MCGGDFTIRTDHSSLKWLLNFKEAEGMMGRWLAHLSEFGLSNTQMEHRSGAKHLNADALSRIPVRLCQRIDCTDCGAHKAVMAGVKLMVSMILCQRESCFGHWKNFSMLRSKIGV